MVECEFAQTMGADYYPATVLIDTWWNVNEITVFPIFFYFSFNRYMVECEFYNDTLMEAMKDWF